MKDEGKLKIDYYKYLIKRLLYKKRKKHLNFNNYGNKKVLDMNSANDFLYNSIISGTPFAVARFGAVELNTVFAEFTDKMRFTRNAIKKSVKRGFLFNNAGVFPNTIEIHRKFSKLLLDQVSELDVLAIWNLEIEKLIVSSYTQDNIKLIELRSLEPWYCKGNCWTNALEGKKVLVIHPFAETIEKQYKKRELIFPKTQYLPQFELHTLKAVQTAAGEKDDRFADWFEALDWMYKEALKIDFDVAIIGCGAYGFPLAAMLKKAGKQAIHMAGATQILFGIKGKRWDNHPDISKLYNEHWVRPSASDIPKDAKKVEGGCYW